MIERHIGTRTCSQIRSHAQKYFMRLDKKRPNSDDDEASDAVEFSPLHEKFDEVEEIDYQNKQRNLGWL